MKSGYGDSTQSVSCQSTCSMTPIAPRYSTGVCTTFNRPMPKKMRTLFTSFTARDIRSPVRWPAKYDCGMRCRCAKSSPRSWYSISRAAVNSTWRDA